MIAGTVLFIILFAVYNKYENLNERREIEKAADIFENIVYKYSVKSMSLRDTFNIEFNYSKKEVIVKEEGKNDILEKIELPQKLNYATVYNSLMLKKIEFNTKETGNISKSFSVYICNYKDNAVYRIAYYNFQQSRILKINVYKNVRAGEINYKDLKEYHYNISENEGKAGWEKQ